MSGDPTRALPLFPPPRERRGRPLPLKEILPVAFGMLGEPVCYLDFDDSVLYWNEAAEELSGYSLDEVQGHDWQDILHPQDEPGKPCPVERLEPQDAGPRHVCKRWIRCKGGDRKLIETTMTIARDRRGEALGVLHIWRDRTGEFIRMRERDDWVSSMVHDLKSPLDSLMGFADLLGEEGADPPGAYLTDAQKNYLRLIRFSGNMLYDLINTINFIYRVEAGMSPYVFEVFSLTEMMEEVREAYFTEVRRTGVNLLVQCETPVSVRADRRWTRRVLQNLISNAFRYTPAGGSITVTVVPRGLRVGLEVRDTGRGIPISEQAHMFQKYVQQEGETAGSGLGLYIVKTVLEAHGSDIRLESAPGEGTAFTFSLPAAGSVTPRRGRVLLVGDEPDLGHMATVLTREGHQVELSGGGMEALQTVRGFHPEVIVLHSSLPDLPVGEVVRGLRAMPTLIEVPLILLAAEGSSDHAGSFSEVLPWPLEMDDLRQGLHSVLGDSQEKGTGDILEVN